MVPTAPQPAEILGWRVVEGALRTGCPDPYDLFPHVDAEAGYSTNTGCPPYQAETSHSADNGYPTDPTHLTDPTDPTDPTPSDAPRIPMASTWQRRRSSDIPR